MSSKVGFLVDGAHLVTDEQRTYTIGKMYEARKKSVVHNKQGRFAPSDQNDHMVETENQVLKMST